MARTKEIITYAIFGAIVALVIYAASQTVAYRPFLRIQNAIDDSHFKRRFLLGGERGNEKERIVIIDIDDRTIEMLGRFKYWPREHFGEVIGTVKRDGAVLTFLDVILMEGGSSRDNSVLADSVRRAGNVLAGYYFNLDAPSVKQRPLDPVFNEQMSSGILYSESINGNHFIKAEEIVLPYARLAVSVSGLGFTNYVPDPDRVVRHLPLYISYGDILYPSAALQMWLHVRGLRYSKVKISPRGIILGDTLIPTDRHCFLRVDYAGTYPAFETMSFVDVLQGNFPDGVFDDSIVMIGSSSTILMDLKRTPVHPSLPGVEIHASALQQLLNERFISVIPGNKIFSMTLAFGVITAILFTVTPPIKVGLPLALIIPCGLYLAALYSFTFHSILMNISLPSFVVLILYIVMTIHRFVEKHEAAQKIQHDPELTT
ncbi:CHASE2 domain-containing protein [Candidatus Latescibacterota bacterium]